MTAQEVEATKAHFDKVAREIRTELRAELDEEIARVNDTLREKTTEGDKHALFMIQGLRDQIASLQHSVNFRLEALASELRIRDRDARAQTRRLRESNDELRDRVQALSIAPVNPLD